MGFNFNNPIEILTKYSQFKGWIAQCKTDPKKLLLDELKRRNISEGDLSQLLQVANQMKNILGVK